jgi:hypothetical protein
LAKTFFLRNQANFIAAALLLIFIVLVFFPGLNYPFLEDWDDGTFIIYNRNLEFTLENFLLYGVQPFQELYTPLPMYSFMIDRSLFGLNALGYRLHNILLHFTGCYFLFLIARRLGIRVWLDFAAALLWAVNPQKVESVIWITERKDVLCGALSFASLWFFLRGVSQKRVSYVAGVLAALAIFAKPAAISLPGVMIVGLICLWGTRFSWRKYAQILDFPVSLSLIAVIWAGYVTSHGVNGYLEENWLVPLHNLFWYPLTAIFPYTLNPIYPEIRSIADLLPALFGMILCGAYIYCAYRLKFARRKIICTLLIIAGFTVPVLGLLHYTNFHYCDRYNYLVSWSVWIALALLIEAFLRRKKAFTRYLKAIFIAMFAAFWVITWSYLPYWETCDYLYSYILAKDEIPNWKVLGNSIHAAFKAGNCEVIEDVSNRFNKYHEKYYIPTAMADRSRRFCLAHIAWITQDQDTARKMYKELWKEVEEVGWREFLWPKFTFPIFFRDMAQISILDGKPDEALKFLDRELQVRTPDDYQYFLAIAMKAQIKNDLPTQIKAWKEVVALAPENQLYKTIYENLKKQLP